MTTITVDRLTSAKMALVTLAQEYATDPSAETWRELCRAKATIDALQRCGR